MSCGHRARSTIVKTPHTGHRLFPVGSKDPEWWFWGGVRFLIALVRILVFSYLLWSEFAQLQLLCLGGAGVLGLSCAVGRTASNTSKTAFNLSNVPPIWPWLVSCAFGSIRPNSDGSS